MTDERPLKELLASATQFSATLEDHNVRHVVIAPDGEWTYFKLGRMRPGESTLEDSWLEDLSARLSTESALNHREWAFRRFEGHGGSSFLIERLPTAVLERLPNDVMTGLESQIRREGNGLIIGRPGTSKASMLLWLALKIPDETVLYIADNPPSELPGRHILHVYPPDNHAERRQLERLARLNPTVMWDRIASPSDVHTLFGFAGDRRRWFSIDASSVRSALRALAGYMNQGVDARFDAVVALDASIIGRPEVLNFLTREPDGWHERFHNGDPALDLMNAFSRSDFRPLGTLDQRSETRVAESTRESPAADPTGLGDEPTRAGIRKRPGGNTGDFENPLTVPVEPGDVLYEGYGQARESTDGSGEINLQGFVDQRDKRQNLPEDTRQYDTLKERINEAHTSTTDSALLRDILPEMVRGADKEVNLADLRITRAEDYDHDELRKIRDTDTSNVDYESIPSDALQPVDDEDFLVDFELEDAIDEAWSDSAYENEDDYSSVFEDDLEFSSVAEEDLQTAVAGAAEYTAERIFKPDLETSPTQTANAQLTHAISAAQRQKNSDPDYENEKTEEFTIDAAMFSKLEDDDSRS